MTFPQKSAAQRDYNGKWARESKAFRALPENALCAYCKRQGLIRAANVVDHIIPHRGDKKLFWDRANWQPLCFKCHNEKAAREQASYRTGKPVMEKGCGSDGMPLDPNHPWAR